MGPTSRLELRHSREDERMNLYTEDMCTEEKAHRGSVNTGSVEGSVTEGRGRD